VTRIPLPVTVTTFGTFTSSEAIERLNLPVTLKAASRPAGSVIDWIAFRTSTWTSNVPRIPVRRAVTPLPPWPPPKLRPASVAPIAIVRVSLL
jgi:hypothetical protein